MEVVCHPFAEVEPSTRLSYVAANVLLEVTGLGESAADVAGIGDGAE
jgi:hypothetical protein